MPKRISLAEHDTLEGLRVKLKSIHDPAHKTRIRAIINWDTRIFDDLTKEIDKGGRYWSIPLMCAWIKDHKKTDIPENTVWYRMADLKYSYKSARPHPYKGDTEKQEAFKKGGW